MDFGLHHDLEVVSLYTQPLLSAYDPNITACA